MRAVLAVDAWVVHDLQRGRVRCVKDDFIHIFAGAHEQQTFFVGEHSGTLGSGDGFARVHTCDKNPFRTGDLLGLPQRVVVPRVHQVVASVHVDAASLGERFGLDQDLEPLPLAVELEGVELDHLLMHRDCRFHACGLKCARGAGPVHQFGFRYVGSWSAGRVGEGREGGGGKEGENESTITARSPKLVSKDSKFSSCQLCVHTPVQSRDPATFLFLEKSRESHLSTLLYIFPSSPPLLRTTFPPFPRPLWDAPAHAERTRAALDSSKANVARGTISAARLRGPSGETTAPWFIARIAGQNQYNKLLGNVRFTFREFGSDRIQYSKLLEMMTSSNFKYLTLREVTDSTV